MSDKSDYAKEISTQSNINQYITLNDEELYKLIELDTSIDDYLHPSIESSIKNIRMYHFHDTYDKLAKSEYKLESGVPSVKPRLKPKNKGEVKFKKILKLAKKEICKHYKDREGSLEDLSELCALISVATAGTPEFRGVSITAAAILISRIGVREMCKEKKSRN